MPAENTSVQPGEKSIDYFSKGHPLTRFRSHFAWRARQAMLECFMSTFSIGPNSKVLDIGVTPDTSLRESNHFEQRFPYPANLTATSIEGIDNLKARFPEVTFLRTGPGRLPFEDGQFDAVFCSAVIEHVGSCRSQAAFMAELSRVARGFMLTTPNRWYPLEFHTILPVIHWLPREKHRALLRLIGKDFWSNAENLNLMSAGDLRRAAPQGVELHVDHVKLMGWPSNLIAWGKREDAAKSKG